MKNLLKVFNECKKGSFFLLHSFSDGFWFWGNFYFHFVWRVGKNTRQFSKQIFFKCNSPLWDFKKPV
jgi:hypothetical protein